MFRKNIEKNCMYCAYGEKLKLNDDMLCAKFGVTAVRYSCPKFRYAPLKRVPNRKSTFESGFSISDFLIKDTEKTEN